ncbi:unnamed protein product, partial [Adineta steineri]
MILSSFVMVETDEWYDGLVKMVQMEKQSFLTLIAERNEVRRWKQGEKEGTIVAGGNGKGNHLNQLNCPTHICVDEDHSIYVSDCDNHRVMKWMKGAIEGIVVAGGNGEGNRLTQLSYPQGVTVDHLGNVYVADWNNHRIMRWCEGDKEGEVVVGRNRKGKQPNQLNGPTGLSLDVQGNLYVVNCYNNRVQKFDTYSKFNVYERQSVLVNPIDINTKWKQHGVTIAGGNGYGNQFNQLSYPQGIYVDDDHQTIYIADHDNHRIVQWKYEANNGQVVAGRNEEGNRRYQLNGPRDVIVDKKNDSLIICDGGNGRVVRWSRQNGTNGETIIS